MLLKQRNTQAKKLQPQFVRQRSAADFSAPVRKKEGYLFCKRYPFTACRAQRGVFPFPDRENFQLNSFAIEIS